jgi:hypothetical protein
MLQEAWDEQVDFARSQWWRNAMDGRSSFELPPRNTDFHLHGIFSMSAGGNTGTIPSAAPFGVFLTIWR